MVPRTNAATARLVVRHVVRDIGASGGKSGAHVEECSGNHAQHCDEAAMSGDGRGDYEFAVSQPSASRLPQRRAQLQSRRHARAQPV